MAEVVDSVLCGLNSKTSIESERLDSEMDLESVREFAMLDSEIKLEFFELESKIVIFTNCKHIALFINGINRTLRFYQIFKANTLFLQASNFCP